LQIRHSQLEAEPRPEAFYRCHTCQLDLVFDREKQALRVLKERDDDRRTTTRKKRTP
jgi:hypothetical protein